MSEPTHSILVTGATGTQGGATARALLRSGRSVRAMVRDPDTPAAQALAKEGCKLVVADFEQPEALAAALEGVVSLFSIQRPDLDNSNSERRHGFALIEAAKAAGVSHFVHSSVCQVADHEHFPRWDEGYWSISYWTDKWAVEEKLRAAAFPKWTILRPSFIMENFTFGKAQYLFPQLEQGELLTPIAHDSNVQMIAGDDIGALAAAAFTDPTRFNGKIIELVGDEMTVDGIAAVLQNEYKTRIKVSSVSPETALEAGLAPGWVRSQEWINEVGYQVDPEPLKEFPVELTGFQNWVHEHHADIVVSQ